MRRGRLGSGCIEYLTNGCACANHHSPAIETPLLKPKGYTFTEGKHPHRPGACEFKIPTDLIERYLRYGPAHKFFDLHLIPHVLMHPAAIFEGLEREEQQSGLCYAGIPSF